MVEPYEKISNKILNDLGPNEAIRYSQIRELCNNDIHTTNLVALYLLDMGLIQRYDNRLKQDIFFRGNN